jgi:hypothetical protein
MPEKPVDEYADLPPVLDADAIARTFGVVPRVAARWLCDGTIPSRKLGKRRFALRGEILRLLRTTGPGRGE